MGFTHNKSKQLDVLKRQLNKETAVINPNSSFPVFIIGNLDKAKTFYSTHFGFGVAFENEWYLHLVSNTGIQIGFLLPNQPTQPNIFHKSYNGTGAIFSLEVDDVESAYAEAMDKKLNIVLQLLAEDWGQHHFCIADPNGIILDIVQEFEPTEEYQKGYETP